MDNFFHRYGHTSLCLCACCWALPLQFCWFPQRCNVYFVQRKAKKEESMLNKRFRSLLPKRKGKKIRKAAETSPVKWNLQPQTSLFIFLRHLVEFKEKNFKKMHYLMWNSCGECMRKLNAGPGHNGYFMFDYIMRISQHFNALSQFLSIYVLFMFHVHNNNVYGTLYNGNN